MKPKPLVKVWCFSILSVSLGACCTYKITEHCILLFVQQTGVIIPEAAGQLCHLGIKVSFLSDIYLSDWCCSCSWEQSIIQGGHINQTAANTQVYTRGMLVHKQQTTHLLQRKLQFEAQNWNQFSLLVPLLLSEAAIWGRPTLLHVCMNSPHWQQLTIILPGHWPIRTGLLWLPAHTRALHFSPPTASAYSRYGDRDGRNDGKMKQEREVERRNETHNETQMGKPADLIPALKRNCGKWQWVQGKLDS